MAYSKSETLSGLIAFLSLIFKSSSGGSSLTGYIAASLIMAYISAQEYPSVILITSDVP